MYTGDFAGRNPPEGQLRIKPDLVAPGAYLVAANGLCSQKCCIQKKIKKYYYKIILPTSSPQTASVLKSPVYTEFY